MRKFFGISHFKVILFFVYLAWSFLFIFGITYFSGVEEFFRLVREGVSFVNWNGYLLMKVSYLVLWAIVSVFIFSLIFAVEFISLYIHNKKIERSMVGGNEAITRKSTFVFRGGSSLIYWTGALFFLVISLFYFPIIYNWLIEILASFIEGEYLKMTNNFDYSFTTIEFVAFGILSPFWYSASCVCAAIVALGNESKQEEELNKNHNAVESTF